MRNSSIKGEGREKNQRKGKNKKSKATWKEKEKTIILYFLSASDVQPHFRNQGLNIYSGCSENQHFHNESPSLPLPLPQLLCWAWCHTAWNNLFTSLGLLSWQCPFPTSCPPPAYWSLGVRLGVGDTVFMLCQLCSAVAKTLVQYKHCCSCKCKAQHHMVCCGES